MRNISKVGTMKKRLLLVGSLIVFMLFTGQVWAIPITVNNFSFELPLSNNGGTGGPGTNWVYSVNDPTMGVYVPTITQYTPVADGVAGIVPAGNQAAYSGVAGEKFSQNTAEFIANDTTYTLRVFVSNRQDFPFPTTAGTIGLTHSTTAGGVGTAIPGATFSMTVPTDGHWLDETVSFTTAGNPFLGEYLGIAIIEGSTGGQINYDNVRLDSVQNAIPEPATMLLLGLGLVGLAGIRRKFRS